MRRLSLTFVLVLGGLLTGCAGKNQPTAADDLGAARKHLDHLLSETRTEAQAMRTEMANTRIAAAKQEAELKELRQEAVERRQMIDAQKTELNAIKAERDRLAQAKTDLHSQLQTQTAEVSRLRATANEFEIVRAKVFDLESQLASRIAELSQAKKDLEQQVKLANTPDKHAKGLAKSKKPESAKSDSARAAPPIPAKAASKAVLPDQKHAAQEEQPRAVGKSDVRLADLRITQEPGTQLLVQPGDSLQQIAKRHGLTVDQLKQANGLGSDQIEPGQLLIIPLSQPGPKRQ